jgi:tripartite-type tricarboxylate transporter receptor subunit TctC
MSGNQHAAIAAMTASRFARAISAALAIAGIVLAGAPVQAQTYPNRPVRVVLPFAAGGVADISSRIVAEKLGDRLGQRFFVENQPGAGGIVAARSVLSTPADGYTLALLTNGTAISVPLFASLPFDPLKDFTPISTLGYFDCLLVANAESEFRTLADFLKAAREKPGAFNIGTINVGGTQNLAAELFRSTAGIKVVIIPYRSTPEAVVALLRGDVQMVIDFYAALRPGLEDGKTRALAWSGAKPSPALPQVPTAGQAGVAGYEVSSWNALYAPAGTPPEVIETVNRALRGVLADPDLRKRLLELGIESKASTPAEMDAQMRADIKKWGDVIARANIPKQ